jgi:hypothetical protein
MTAARIFGIINNATGRAIARGTIIKIAAWIVTAVAVAAVVAAAVVTINDVNIFIQKETVSIHKAVIGTGTDTFAKAITNQANDKIRLLIVKRLRGVFFF